MRRPNAQAEAQEARANAEKELAEMHEARADAERERAEADEAKANAIEERAQADRARAIAIKERAEANAAKEAWRQKQAMEQALKWKSRTKKLPARKEPKKKKKPKDMPPPRSVVEDMLGRVSSSLRTFESEYKIERSRPVRPENTAAAIESHYCNCGDRRSCLEALSSEPNGCRLFAKNTSARCRGRYHWPHCRGKKAGSLSARRKVGRQA